jgi:tetratricopeptide (TPR) repeat protein
MNEMVEEAAARALSGAAADRAVGDYARLLLDYYRQVRTVLYEAPDTAERLANVLGWAQERLPEENLFWRYEYGRVAYDRGEYAESAEALREVVRGLGIAADPDRLAQLLENATPAEREQYRASENPLVQAHAVLAYLGRTLISLGEWEEARQVFSDSWRLNPDNPLVAFYLEELSAPDPLSRFPQPGR